MQINLRSKLQGENLLKRFENSDECFMIKRQYGVTEELNNMEPKNHIVKERVEEMIKKWKE